MGIASAVRHVVTWRGNRLGSARIPSNGSLIVHGIRNFDLAPIARPVAANVLFAAIDTGVSSDQHRVTLACTKPLVVQTSRLFDRRGSRRAPFAHFQRADGQVRQRLQNKPSSSMSYSSAFQHLAFAIRRKYRGNRSLPTWIVLAARFNACCASSHRAPGSGGWQPMTGKKSCA
jgi:hypothetical protein